LNLKDNGFNVIIGCRDWTRAKADGWKPGKDLFSIEEAAQRGTIILSLVSDAGQAKIWSQIRPHLTKGKALGFSHGFAIEYRKLMKIDPPKDIDIILAAPKGSGLNVRRNFLSGAGINSSFGVYQDATGRAVERATAVGIGIGSGFLFPTTFSKEVVSDLTGERGVLMGALAGIIDAQYEVLRKNGHSPSEAFNETVEELTQSLIRLVDEKRHGLDVRQLLDHRPARRARLAPQVQEGHAARLQRPLQVGQDRRRSPPRHPRVQRPGLQAEARQGTQGPARVRAVDRRRRSAQAPPERKGQGRHQVDQGRRRSRRKQVSLSWTAAACCRCRRSSLLRGREWKHPRPFSFLPAAPPSACADAGHHPPR
jgi:ketol-acid reductoisomerase